MARLSSNPITLHRFQPCLRVPQPPQIIGKPRYSHRKTRRSQTPACQATPNLDETSTTERPFNEATAVNGQTSKVSSSSLGSSDLLEFPSKDINKKIAAVSALAAVGLFLSARLDFGVSLKDISVVALPYEEALSNGKPTAVEFYANWYEVCRELAPNVYKVE
ncbi:hypothetical protein QN277_026776 [Acacia crassicarpa]|uniref:Uncharacterized protein n=1 Tax=Acacia crassicarpa TaxID=499986 RepID=A0AAE1ML51_9FABA|nr:hypothetical protein QN277_026776 [Acacia crassicarpa]